jgi:multidrug resistance efflux pump
LVFAKLIGIMDDKNIVAYGDLKDGQYDYLRTLSAKSNAIYNTILLFTIAAILALPFIYVQVSTVATVAIQPQQQKEIVFSPIAGKVAKLAIGNNKPVIAGDTILAIDYSLYANDLYNGVEGKSKRSKSISHIVANISGISYVGEGLQLGTYIQAGQKVAEILPDTGLIAVCYVSPKDIGYIKPGHRVQLQIDSYNYFDWGMLNASVTEIFKDVVQIEKNPFYVVHCKMDKPFLTFGNNGIKGDVLKGMTGRANFIQNKISLWQLLFRRVNKLVNPNAN